MLHIRWDKLYNYYYGTKYEASTANKTVDILKLLLKITRENCYNDSGKFKYLYISGSSFHHTLPPFSIYIWKINNDLTMYLMKMIVDYTGTKDPVITNTLMVRSSTMVDEVEYDMIDNKIGNYDNSFQLGLFGDHQNRVDLENLVANNLVTAGIFYKQAVPIFKK